MARFKAGDIAYILESNRSVREVTIVRCSGGMYLIRFNDTSGGIQVKEHRLFETEELAENSMPHTNNNVVRKGNHSPYDYGA